jgi:Restriction Enzyme Adenine Methylase Associated
VEAGDPLVGTRNRIEYSATVSRDGEITLPTGEIFASPDEAGAFALNQKSCKGWSFWNVMRPRGRISLENLRSEAASAGLLD